MMNNILILQYCGKEEAIFKTKSSLGLEIQKGQMSNMFHMMQRFAVCVSEYFLLQYGLRFSH